MRKKLLLGAALMGAVASASGPVLAHHDAPEGAIWRPSRCRRWFRFPIPYGS